MSMMLQCSFLDNNGLLCPAQTDHTEQDSQMSAGSGVWNPVFTWNIFLLKKYPIWEIRICFLS
jgi:hypothetical protein